MADRKGASAADTLPEPVMAQFRATALERVPRIESAWVALTHGTRDPSLVAALGREIHTLKGDAGVVGYESVQTLCETIEEIVAFGKERDFRVPEEVGIVATMAFQFIGLYLRKRSPKILAGIDLLGFAEQVEETLRDAGGASGNVPAAIEVVVPVSSAAEEAQDRLSLTTRRKLSAAATSVFLEYLQAVGPTRERLHMTWRAMAGELTRLEASPLMPVLARHAGAAKQLAESMGKEVEITLALGGVMAAADASAALDHAVLHAIRNAVDHGLEGPAERKLKGKAPVGRITISAAMNPDTIVVTVEDDGRGIDFNLVRSRAIERGIWDQATARKATNAELLELLFMSGFSTRMQTTTVSGRGVGLDAAKNALRRVEGAVSLISSPGRGVKMTLHVPQSIGYVGVTTFMSARANVKLAVSSAWTARIIAPNSSQSMPADPVEGLCLNPRVDAPSSQAPIWVELSAADGRRYRVLAGSRPKAAVAERICVTELAEPIEVVSIAGVEALLLRLDRVPGLTRVS